MFLSELQNFHITQMKAPTASWVSVALEDFFREVKTKKSRTNVHSITF